MGDKFLYKLADEVIKNGHDFQKLCIVFPSKRAGLYFKKYLADILQKNFFPPDILNIQEFVQNNSGLNTADELILLYELFECYKKIYGDKFTFERFYSFGKLLLNDFNNIDKNLVHTETLFRIIKNYKEIEQQFPHPIDNEVLNSFMSAFDNYLSSPETDFFKEFWNKIDMLYTSYKSVLQVKNINYEGMIYRNFADNISKCELEKKYMKIIFAGFNYLTKSELKIFEELKEKNIAEFYFDADSFYLSNEKFKNHEAGVFIEKDINILQLNSKDLKWIDNNIETTEKHIKVYSGASDSGQGKIAGQLINENKYDPPSTVLILPDENLLMPVLSSLPESCKEFNITMSYPLYLTPVKSLINNIISFHKNKKYINGELYFNTEDFQMIILHPYFKFLSAGAVYKLRKEIVDNKLFYISSPHIKTILEDFKDEIDLNIFDLLFTEVRSVSDIINLIKQIFTHLIENLKKFEINSIEIEFLYSTILSLNKLEDILVKNKYEMDYDAFTSLITELIYSEKIPFTGEPLSGLQIMGLFESRLLDFENVIILSANEGKFPPLASNQSIIPYNLRKAFCMTLPEDMVKNYAYLFYRLLQRSKNIDLLYNSDLSSENKERSRYIYQLEYELSKNPNVKFENKSAVFSDTFIDADEIAIEKSDIIYEKFKRYETNYEDKNTKKYFSATSLNKFINCRLQFYFQHVLELKQPDELEFEIDPGMFGSLLHTAMYKLYSEAQEKSIEVTSEYINLLKSKIDTLINDVLKEEFRNVEHNKGRFILIRKTLKLYIEKILTIDAKHAPFKILHLEHKIKHEINILNHAAPVSLKAMIDRVDIKDDVLRIIDYKTSKIEISKYDRKDEVYTNPDFSEEFQMNFYGFLLRNTELGKDKNLQIGFYTMRESTNEVKLVTENFSHEDLNNASEKISSLINDIFDKNTPFTQATDIKNCVYCDFKIICHRLEEK